jgi:hypothetical protein
MGSHFVLYALYPELIHVYPFGSLFVDLRPWTHPGRLWGNAEDSENLASLVIFLGLESACIPSGIWHQTLDNIQFPRFSVESWRERGWSGALARSTSVLPPMSSVSMCRPNKFGYCSTNTTSTITLLLHLDNCRVTLSHSMQ